jgi:hypothetical protein
MKLRKFCHPVSKLMELIKRSLWSKTIRRKRAIKRYLNISQSLQKIWRFQVPALQQKFSKIRVKDPPEIDSKKSQRIRFSPKKLATRTPVEAF